MGTFYNKLHWINRIDGHYVPMTIGGRVSRLQPTGPNGLIILIIILIILRQVALLMFQTPVASIPLPLSHISMMEGYVKTYVFTYVINVNTLQTAEEDAHSPSWPLGLLTIIIIIILIICLTSEWSSEGGVKPRRRPPRSAASLVSIPSTSVRRFGGRRIW
jgi:hypothetical protein